MDTPSLDIGLIGLAVMGQNLVLNMNDNNFAVGVYNRTTSVTTEFLDGPAKGTAVVGFGTLEDLVTNLKRPRKIMLMVQAGPAVDKVIDSLLPYLEAGDIVIDGGNTNYPDSVRRAEDLESRGLLFVGTGVSGGEEGARSGPSIMPGGSHQAWEHIAPIFQSIAAQVDGTPCCDWVGDGGAGHFVKMVHNGIEYGDMQLITEAYHLMKSGLGMQAEQIGEVFSGWRSGKLDSYLIDITAEIFTVKDSDGEPLVEKILDVAGQKGTGKWTAVNALELGIPLTLIGEAVFSRFLSSIKTEREEASQVLQGPSDSPSLDQAKVIEDLEQALYASKICSYAQGYMLIRAAAEEYGWELNYGGIAQMWRGGCIIRSSFLKDIRSAYGKNQALKNLLLDDFFRDEIESAQGSWRHTVSTAVKAGIPTPAMGAALAFFDGYRHAELPANLLQAQRDYFGAHTYERIDRPRGEFHHTNWTGRGGKVSSRTYNA
jgi:6-phosphogluconate dehydrogenase